VKKIRLPIADYAVAKLWHLTICAADGTSPFVNDGLTRDVIDQLRASSSKCGIRVHLYCFMPDHVHLLVGNPDGDDVIRFVRHFKQLTGYSFKQANGSALWQERFYDRVLRGDSEIEAVSEYIWRNPVEEGVVADAEAYPYSGSFEWETR
jgi:REP element-mobilizing transposase RayT